MLVRLARDRAHVISQRVIDRGKQVIKQVPVREQSFGRRGGIGAAGGLTLVVISSGKLKVADHTFIISEQAGISLNDDGKPIFNNMGTVACRWRRSPGAGVVPRAAARSPTATAIRLCSRSIAAATPDLLHRATPLTPSS
jgi:hypothetical protein